MEARQCWAHDRHGHRCQKKATHRSDHVWSVTWADEDAYHPVAATYTPVQPVEPPAPALDRVVPKAAKCVACGHLHAGECKCGCREFIG